MRTAIRISSAQSKQPEKVSAYMAPQVIFPLPAREPAGRTQPLPALHSRIWCNAGRRAEVTPLLDTRSENSLERHFFRQHGRGVSTARPSASTLQVFSRRSAQHDSKERVWQAPENRREKQRI